MARPKSNTTPSTAKTTVEDVAKEETTEVTETAAVETPKEEKTAKKEKEINDDDSIVVVCQNLAGRKVRGLDNVYDFDADGKATVTGKDAKRFLTIPGYSIAK